MTLQDTFCKACDKSYHTPSGYKRHLARKHDDVRDYRQRMETPREDQKCKHCMEIFATAEIRKHHTQVFHAGLSPNPRKKRKSIYSCVICPGVRIGSHRALVAHRNAIHQENKKIKKRKILEPLVAMPCGTFVRRKDNKERHVARCGVCSPDSQAPVFTCNVANCNRVYSLRYSLSRHKKMSHPARTQNGPSQNGPSQNGPDGSSQNGSSQNGHNGPGPALLLPR
jgi:hypothetical protein